MADQVVEITTTEEASEIITVSETTVIATPVDAPVLIVTEGLQGPPGGPGVPGPPGVGEAFKHEQLDPATITDIGHGLDRFPSVTLTELDGTIMEAEVRFVDSNNIRVRTTYPTSFIAYLN